MKVFITGIAGMLGCNIAYELKDKYIISGVDLINVDMSGIETYAFDMLDYQNLSNCIKKIKPDIIIHTAAAVNVDRCELEPEYAKKLNVDLTESICHISREINAKVIYISTDAVFDGEDRELYCETDILNPINIYGKTKLEGEYIVAQYKNNLILRTNIYGFNIQNKNSFGEWIYKSLMNDECLNMFDDIDFSPILVNDLAKLIHLCIEDNIYGIYHACGTGCITKYDFGCELKKVFNISSGSINKTKSDSFSFKAKRSKHMGMNNSKLSDKLKCTIRTPAESIQEFYRLYISDYKMKLSEFGRIDYGNKDRK